MFNRYQIGLGLLTMGLGAVVSLSQSLAPGLAISAIGALILVWPSRWVPGPISRLGRAGKAREALREIGSSLEDVLAAADEVWVRLSYIAKRNFGPPLDEPLAHLIDKADARERRNVRQAADALIGRLRAGDPRPYVVPAYSGYREWRDEIVKLASMMGSSILSLNWKDAERRFFGDLRKKLDSPGLEAEKRAVGEYDAEHGQPGPLPD
jgi:hypothetical protein